MILWLSTSYGLSTGTKALLLGILRAHGLTSGDVIFYSLHGKTKDLVKYNPKAKVPEKALPPKGAMNFARQDLSAVCATLRPSVIVINDEATLRTITQKPYSLSQVRGSVYQFSGIPCLVLGPVAHIYNMNHGKFEFGLYLAKLLRLHNGIARTYPKFEQIICKTFTDVRQCVELSEHGVLIASDTETANQFITVVSHTFAFGDRLLTFTIPFFDPFLPNGCYWESADEECAVRMELAKLHKNKTPKALQNGMYDTAYFIEAGWEYNEYIVDTYHIMHSLWCESPKALHEICSYFLDNYVYWKDEAKGVHEEGFGRTHADVEQYWHYNGLDTYWLWLAAVELVKRVVQIDWAMRNYSDEFSLAIGPCLAASLRGIKVDAGRHAQIMETKRKEADAGINDIRELTCEPAFNPYSPHDVAWWIYDVLGAQTTRLQDDPKSSGARKGGKKVKYGARSTDEKVLKLMKEQRNVVLSNFIDRLLRAKKPAGVLSKYGNLHKLTRRGRFLCWLNPAGTETSRFNSGSSQFWTGTNGQNIPKPLREMFVADPDYVFVDIDYSASDDRFVAYECEDAAKINVVEDEKDSHCFHCSIFFSKPYEIIEEGWKNEDDWVTAEPQGVRQITKKITHGRNYLEGPGTMYNLMGRDAVVATAIALGHANAAAWTDKELIGICKELSDKYDHPQRGLYKRLQPWQVEIRETAIGRDNLASTAFGFTRKFFGDLRANAKTQRELASFYGQGDTAGNINRSLRTSFYGRNVDVTIKGTNEIATYPKLPAMDDGQSFIFLLQVHDSLLFAVHKSALHKIGELKRMMDEKVAIHGRLMRVPASPKVGITWSKKMLDWKPEMTYDDVVAFEAKQFAKKYPPRAVEEILGDIDLNLSYPELEIGSDEAETPDLDLEGIDLQLDDAEGVLEGVD